jgi:LysM repeat protein
MRHLIFTSFAFALVVAGCATQSSTSSSAWPTTPAERELALAHSVPTSAPAGSIYEVRIYIVQPGDTLAKISDRFHLTAQELATLNGYDGADSPYLRKLRVNQRLVIYERISQ